MAQYPNLYNVELTKGPAVVQLQQMFLGDVKANRIGAIVTENGEAVTLGGTCSGTAILSNGGTVSISGTVSGNTCYIDLPSGVYAVEGPVSIFLNNVSGGNTTTLVAAFGNVCKTQTGTVIDPGTVIPSVSALIDSIDAAVASIPADYTALLAAVAPTFSSSTAYTAGRYVWYSGNLYRFTADHAAGTWAGTDAVQVVVTNEIVDLKSALTFVENGTGIIEAKEHAGYLLPNGTWEGTSEMHSLYTDIIPCVAGDVFWFQGSASSPIMFYVNGAYNSNISIKRNIAPIKVAIPSGINGVRFNSRALNGTDVVFSAYKDGSNYDLIVAEIWKTNKLNSIYPKTEKQGYVVGYNDSDGTVQYEGKNTSYHNYTTDPIPCKPGDKFYYKGKGITSNSALFFDDTMTLVSKIGYNTTDKYTEITIPSGVYYVIFTSYSATAGDIVFDLYVDGSVKQTALRVGDIEPSINALTEAKLNAIISGKPLEISVVDGVMGTDGTFSGANEFNSSVTDYIKCKQGDVFNYYGYTSNLVVACMWYTNDKTVLSYERPAGGRYIQTTFTAPANAEYVRFTSYSTKPNIPGLWVSMATTYGSPLTGKTWYACGDSFTAGDFADLEDTRITSGRYVGRYKTYQFLIGNRTNANVKYPIAISGETIAAYTNGTVVFSNANYQYGYKSVGTDADYITLWFGINDSGHSIPIGTIDDDDNTTFYGAWNVVLDDLTTRCTKAHIGIIVSNNLSQTYVDAVIAVAKKWGIPYLDLNYDNSVPLMHYSLRPDASAAIKAKRNEQFSIAANNHHPNLLAHEYESYFIEKWLLSL